MRPIQSQRRASMMTQRTRRRGRKRSARVGTGRLKVADAMKRRARRRPRRVARLQSALQRRSPRTSRRARLYCAMAGDCRGHGKAECAAPVPEMGAPVFRGNSHGPRGTAEAGRCGRNAAFTVPVAAAQEDGGAMSRALGSERNDGKRLATIIDGDAEKKATRPRRMQTTSDSGYQQQVIAKESLTSIRLSEPGGAAKIRGSTSRNTGTSWLGSGRAIRKTSRVRTLRCPLSLLASSSQTVSVQPDAITGGAQAGADPTTRRNWTSLAPTSSSLTRASYTRSMSSGASSLQGNTSPLVLRQRFNAEQSQIQSIIDRLRQKTARAIMATTAAGNNRTIQTDPSSSQLADDKLEITNEMNLIKTASRAHHWHWSDVHRSHECMVSKDRLSLCFHPQCSESAAACRASEPFRRNGNYYYWEIHVQDKIYGTSVMFGLCTKQQRLHANEYCNLIGLDEMGWSLSHKGLAWHSGKNRQFTKTFPTNQPVTIGLLYNTMRGELSYFMDGKNMGVAFSGLNDIDADLYAVVGSTAKCTRMRLVGSYCGYVSLLERSCFTLIKSARNRSELIEYLRQYKLPKNLLDYIAQAANVSQHDPQADTNHGSGTAMDDGPKQESQNFEDNYHQSMNESHMSA